MPSKKNAPRFLDYRRSPLPLVVAIALAIPSCISARELVLSGRVHVNEAVETSCHRLVCRNDDCIAVIYKDGDDTESMTGVERPISVTIPLPRYFICYKPRGVVCSSRKNEGIDREDSVLITEWLANICDAHSDATTKKTIDAATIKSIKTVGRLDEESEGLLLLTNDGSFSRLLCDPEFGLKKTYRVLARGSGYSRLVAEVCQTEYNYGEKEIRNGMSERVAEMITCGNKPPPETNATTPHFPFESCQVLDVGKLPSQHSSDDSYYVLVDLTLREGKTHAVRRIIKNAGGGLRVCYLSRISVEGLDTYDVVKPKSINDAQEEGCLTVGRHASVVPACKLVLRSGFNTHDSIDDGSALLQPGHVMELKGCDVDKIFALRR